MTHLEEEAEEVSIEAEDVVGMGINRMAETTTDKNEMQAKSCASDVIN